MKNGITVFLLVVASLLAQHAALAGPEEDRLAFIAYFEARFPDIAITDHANGIYAIDSAAREQWEDIEVFPPYEFAVEQGKEHWQETFTDGGSYGDCFADPVQDIRPRYPRFDNARGEVVTLDGALNNCRLDHDEPALAFDDAALISVTAFLAYESRGRELDIRVPADNAAAMAAYEAGKQFYYSKRGQLNFACSDCHGISAGQYIRADRLSAGLGHPTHFPVYRSKLGRVISLHERFAGCVRDIRAMPFELQSREFINLEYFLTYMSNGFVVNGPGARK